MTISVDAANKVYQIPYTDGVYASAKFDNVYNDLHFIAARLAVFKVDIGPVRRDQIGTVEQYKQYQLAINSIGNHDIGGMYSSETPMVVQKILDHYMSVDTCSQLRVFYGDMKTGRDYVDDIDVIGRIGSIGAPLKFPTLILRDGSMTLLGPNIVRLMEVDSYTDLYRHENYHQPSVRIVSVVGAFKFECGITVNGVKSHKTFKSYSKAANYVAFLDGESMNG